MSKKKKKKNLREDLLTKRILAVLVKYPRRSMGHKELGTLLEISDSSGRNQIVKKLQTLSNRGEIEETERGKYRITKTKNIHEAVLDLTTRGDAYAIVEGMENDIFISKHKLNKAFHGDTVQIHVQRRKQRGKLEGEVLQIVQRKTTEFVGILELQETFGFVVMKDPKMYVDVFVSKKDTLDAKDGMMVLVEIESWEEKKDSPTGRIKQILGVPGEHDTEMHAILAQYGLPYEFPKEIEAFAAEIDTSIQPAEIAKRRDMRDTLTFTIDPKDAKDFDDALSFKKLPNGNFEIGIHIADVSHYVTPGSILDEETYTRATSVYLVDRVVPMLPEVLSNMACSLRPLEEKYTFSAVFEVNKKAEVVNEWYGRTVTYSDARFSYEEAQHIIETKDPEIPASIAISGEDYTAPSEVAEAVLELDVLAKIMRKERMHNGAISFDKVEVKFELNAANEPTGVFFKTSKDANKLIEEFMLLANRKVAELLSKQKPKPCFVYRCHDEPKEDKLHSLQTVIKNFGYTIDTRSSKTISSSLNSLLEEVKGKKEQNLVDTLTIRTMSKAYYSTENIGHYGLSFDDYTHFTSPIRRYPDIMVHRLLQDFLDKKASANSEEYEEKCKHSSEMESLSTNAERDSVKYMQIKYMQDHKNEQFLGVISGVTDFGVFIEIVQNKCEGMVRLKDMADDHYDFDAEQFAIVGRKTGKTYQLGDEVYISVKNADLVKRQMDFNLVGSRLDIEL